jgi:hypothetical protein
MHPACECVQMPWHAYVHAGACDCICMHSSSTMCQACHRAVPTLCVTRQPLSCKVGMHLSPQTARSDYPTATLATLSMHRLAQAQLCGRFLFCAFLMRSMRGYATAPQLVPDTACTQTLAGRQPTRTPASFGITPQAHNRCMHHTIPRNKASILATTHTYTSR